MYTTKEYKQLRDDYDEAVNALGIAMAALEDILSADETSTLAGAIAIATHAMQKIKESHVNHARQ